MTSREWRWLTPPVVRILHARLINSFGGLHGEGGPGELDAVLLRPQNLAAFDESIDTYDLAAAYADELVTGHVFTDGNKRIGFTAALVFLRLNGIDLPVKVQAVATERTLALAVGAITRTDFAAWLR